MPTSQQSTSQTDNVLPALNLIHSKTPSRRHGQARRFVDTRPLDRQSWLAVRQTGIGSSDAAAAVGLNPYKSRLELWMDKTGRDMGDRMGDSPDSDSPMYWGNVLEPIVAEHYAKRTGHQVRRVNSVLQHPDHPWMLANLDREVRSNPAVQVLECKTAGINGAKLWREGVPEYVQLQVMHQLAVTGQEAADVAVLVGGQELRIFRIDRDDALIDRLITLEQTFWNYVQQDIPPPADDTDSAGRALRALYPSDNHQSLDLTDDPDLSSAFTQLQDVRTLLNKTKKQEAQLKHQLQQALGDASEAIFSEGRITWKQSVDARVVDLKRLKEAAPELLDPYFVIKPGSRRFVVHNT